MPAWHGSQTAKLPLVALILLAQGLGEYLIWKYLDPTVAILVTPVIAWLLIVRVVRWPRISGSILVALAWWAGLFVAANTFGT
jgi:hypothetical protein